MAPIRVKIIFPLPPFLLLSSMQFLIPFDLEGNRSILISNRTSQFPIFIIDDLEKIYKVKI